MTSSSKPLIYLEGNIGAGKSTLCKCLSARYGYSTILEPVESLKLWKSWNPLDEFYKKKINGFTFQCFCLSKVVENMIEKLQELEQNGICGPVIAERNPATCLKAFGPLVLDNAFEKDVYELVFKQMTPREYLEPKGLIYLNTPPEVCYERMGIYIYLYVDK